MKKLLFLITVFTLVLSCSSDETSTPVTPPPAPIVKYTITLSAGEGGTVSTTGGEFESGQTVSVTATPQGEYLFKDWSDGNTDATRTITVSSNSTLTANFEKRKYPLTVNFEGEGEVIEEIVNSGRTTEYDSGTAVKLTAQAAAEWVFVGWTGDIESTEESVQILIGEPKEVTATFEKKKYPLTVNIEGEGEVLEEIVNAGRSTDYNSGTTIKLTAVPSEGWEFTGWAGAINGTSNPQQLLISEPKTVSATFNLMEEIETPLGFKIEKQEYSLKLEWDYNTDSRIDSVIIYKGKSLDALYPFKSLANTQPLFEDNLVGVRERYFYKVAFKDGENLTSFSEVQSEIPIEPINTNTPIKNEIGGIHYAYWDFTKPTLEKISHKFTIHEEPTNEDGSFNGDGLYYQFYQGILNDTIGFYYGIQTRLYRSGVGYKKGLIFSRWKTRDTTNYSNSSNSWSESAGYEGDFIGLREHYEWEVGSYETVIEKDSTDTVGDWYSLKIKNLQNDMIEYIGSLRFETSSKSSGIKSGGITWSELYGKVSDTPAPNWHVSVDEVIADDYLKPFRVYTTYSDNKFLGFNNIYTTNNKDVHFLMGPKVKKTNGKGYLWSN